MFILCALQSVFVCFQMGESRWGKQRGLGKGWRTGIVGNIYSWRAWRDWRRCALCCNSVGGAVSSPPLSVLSLHPRPHASVILDPSLGPAVLRFTWGGSWPPHHAFKLKKKSLIFWGWTLSPLKCTPWKPSPHFLPCVVILQICSVSVCSRMYSNCSGPGFSLHSEIIMPYISHYGSSAQIERYIPQMTAGKCIGAIAMTEPGAGRWASA